LWVQSSTDLPGPSVCVLFFIFVAFETDKKKKTRKNKNQMSKIDDLELLIGSLLGRRGDLPERGKRTHDKASWYLELIHEVFPEEADNCVSLGSCIKLLVKKHVNSVEGMKRIDLQPYLNASREAFFLRHSAQRCCCQERRGAQCRSSGVEDFNGAEDR
jgi:hypothetical protein